jgi:hypothetical protein
MHSSSEAFNAQFIVRSQLPWLPSPLLPRKQEQLIDPDEATRIVAWRLHIHDTTAAGLPNGAGHSERSGLFLRFTVTWSYESKRTSITHAVGVCSWREDDVLALPNGTGDGPSDSELDVALCARIHGRPDEVLASNCVMINGHAGKQRMLTLHGSVFTGTETTISFSFDVAGLTRAQAEGEWNTDQPLLSSGWVDSQPGSRRDAHKHSSPLHSSSITTVLPSAGAAQPGSARPTTTDEASQQPEQSTGGKADAASRTGQQTQLAVSRQGLEHVSLQPPLLKAPLLLPL